MPTREEWREAGAAENRYMEGGNPRIMAAILRARKATRRPLDARAASLVIAIRNILDEPWREYFPYKPDDMPKVEPIRAPRGAINVPKAKPAKLPYAANLYATGMTTARYIAMFESLNGLVPTDSGNGNPIAGL
jgi:hypothetical protein